MQLIKSIGSSIILFIATVIHWFFKFLAFLIAGFFFYLWYFLVIVWNGGKPTRFYFMKYISSDGYWANDEVYITPLDWFLNKKLDRYEI